MNIKYIPDHLKKTINGIEYFFLSKTLAWLKDSSQPIQVHQYKKRCNKIHLIAHRDKNDHGRGKIYVTADGLREIIDRSPSIEVSHKKALGLSCGTTTSEGVFGMILKGYFKPFGISVDTQVPCSGYFIDFVIGGIIAIEYDEGGHSSYSYIKEREREKVIKEKYKLYRVNDTQVESEAISEIIADLCPNSGECLNKAIEKARNSV